MTLQKTKHITIIFVVLCIAIFSGFILVQDPLCGLRHTLLMFEVQSYERMPDPEICESLIVNIDSFNEDCEPFVEIFDCG